MTILRREFPDTLDEYHNAEARHNGGETETTCCPAKSAAKQAAFAEWPARVALMNAARQTQANLLLPSLLLAGCVQPMQVFLEPSKLNVANRKAIILGQNKLSALARTDPFKGVWRRVWSPRSSIVGCACAYASSQKKPDAERRIEERAFFPFYQLNFGSLAMQSVCHHCRGAVRHEFPKALGDLWLQLPGIFGLPEWDKLREEANGEA